MTVHYFGRQRQLVPERMDYEVLSPRVHHRALRGLARINRVSHVSDALWPPILRLFSTNGSSLTLLDVACGGGDVAVGLWEIARRHGLQLHVTGCDRNPTALQEAQRAAEAAHCPMRLVPCDALADALPTGFDVVISTLFLHHLTNPQVVVVLAQMREAAQRLVLVSDLRRSLTGFLAAATVPRLLSASPIVHTDALLSVRASLRPHELAQCAASAGMPGAIITPSWPFRMLLQWWRR